MCDCVDRSVLHDTFETRLIKKWDSPLVAPGPTEMACCANTYDKLIHVYGVVSACFDYGNKLWFLIAREHIAHVTHFRRWPTSQDIYYYSSVCAMSEFFRRRCLKKSKQVNRCRSFKTTPKQCDINCDEREQTWGLLTWFRLNSEFNFLSLQMAL